MTDLFWDDIASRGAPQSGSPVSEISLGALTTHLPNVMVEFLREYGQASYFRSAFQYVEPKVLTPILAMVFQADPELSHADCHVVGHTAFGELWVWSEHHGVLKINLADQHIYSRTLAPANLRRPAGFPDRVRSTDPNVLARNLLPRRLGTVDFDDWQGNPIFERCEEMRGALEPGEVFGFFPALGMVLAHDAPGRMKSRERCVENIRRVRAIEHFTILAQLGNFHLMRLEAGQYRSVRPVG